MDEQNQSDHATNVSGVDDIKMEELHEVALWRVTWWEPPDPATTHPRKTVSGSKYWRGGVNRTAEVVASTMEIAIAAVRADNPTAVFTNVTKASGTGLFYVANEEARRG